MVMNKSSGFTLVELMIVVVIVAIIASIAYPAYQDQIQKTRRSDAKAALMDAAARMERFYTQFGRYTGTIASAGIVATSPEQYYQIVPGTIANQTFILRATPQGAQVGDDCGNLDINQAQVKGNSAGLPQNTCW
jgi:type IV pilus assembly protein PilE